MKAHALAAALLKGPDVPVVFEQDAGSIREVWHLRVRKLVVYEGQQLPDLIVELEN